MVWTRGQIIGRGSSATVYTAKDNLSGESVAVKSAELSNSQLLRNEQCILSRLQCPEIVSYRGCDITNENGKQFYNLFLELAPHGTLIDAIREKGGRLEENLIRSYTKRILLGLKYLHSNGIVHCDIKCHNILVAPNGAKIADLGFAKQTQANSAVAGPIAGTPAYMAPEVARGEQQGYPADVWALGCTILEMATGRAPWTDSEIEPISILYQIGFGDKVPEIPSFMSKQAKDFISKCLKRDPMERWTVSELLDHEFIKEESNCSTKEINRCLVLHTPTTVLDQSLWQSVKDFNTSCISAMERIKQLRCQNGDMPDWDWPEDNVWATVRSNNTISSKEQECFSRSQDCSLLEYVNELAHDSEIIRVSITGNEQNLVVSIDAGESTPIVPNPFVRNPVSDPTSICGGRTCNISSIGSFNNCSRQKLLMMVLDCFKAALYLISNFEKKIKWLFSVNCFFIYLHLQVSAANL